jgi:polar amino acid transport system ATP-binding protein
MPETLSGGQKQRVAIARALAMEPEVMLFDEATSALDPELVSEVLLTIQQLAADGMTMVIVTHEIAFAREVADRVAFMRDGVVVEEGPARQTIDEPRMEATRTFLSHFHKGQMPR